MCTKIYILKYSGMYTVYSNDQFYDLFFYNYLVFCTCIMGIAGYSKKNYHNI